MDAASNNSVDDIRELRESVAYSPVSGRSKVYILDEAHMLSTAAWNAFLKTLEEPPPNTVFVLATTEAQKVPATVVDRCHRFDFHRPTVEQIASVVRRAAQAESIEIPPEAVAAVARSATGSFRDALGTLEQLLTYSGPEIALEDVLAVLGVADARLLEELVDAVAAGDARRALLALERCAERRARRGLVRLGPGGARARAAGGADPRASCPPNCRSPRRPTRVCGLRPSAWARRGRAPAGAAGRGDGGRARGRGPAHAAGAGAGEGGPPRGRRLDACAARTHRAAWRATDGQRHGGWAPDAQPAAPQRAADALLAAAARQQPPRSAGPARGPGVGAGEQPRPHGIGRAVAATRRSPQRHRRAAGTTPMPPSTRRRRRPRRRRGPTTLEISTRCGRRWWSWWGWRTRC